MTTESYGRSVEIYDDKPLAPKRLAQIWKMLDERERFPFLLALREDLAEQQLVATFERRTDG